MVIDRLAVSAEESHGIGTWGGLVVSGVGTLEKFVCKRIVGCGKILGFCSECNILRVRKTIVSEVLL